MLVKTKRQIEVVSNRVTKMFSATGYHTLEAIDRKCRAFSHLDSRLRGELNMEIGNLISQHRYMYNAARGSIYAYKPYVAL